MPKKKLTTEVDKVTNSTNPEVKITYHVITPLEITGGLNVTREEFNQVVDKLNQIIKKVN